MFQWFDISIQNNTSSEHVSGKVSSVSDKSRRLMSMFANTTDHHSGVEYPFRVSIFWMRT